MVAEPATIVMLPNTTANVTHAFLSDFFCLPRILSRRCPWPGWPSVKRFTFQVEIFGSDCSHLRLAAKCQEVQVKAFQKPDGVEMDGFVVRSAICITAISSRADGGFEALANEER
jgi:hypothetical protein